MITACKRGHIDLIITKSLSRFARNTVDCLETVRLLKANGIGVYFEKENINTLTESSEFLITLFSGFAQAESESLSKNVAWGKAKSAEAGKVTFQYKRCWDTARVRMDSRRSSRRKPRSSSGFITGIWTAVRWGRSSENWTRIMSRPHRG